MTNTWNLNIAPMSDGAAGFGASSNIVEKTKGNKDFYAKKYMLSIENLAWKSSTIPGFTVNDLPYSERGPNGGRIMWFPPYDMKVSETNSANWNTNEFLGRPETIYTYNNTTRNGNLSWKIVVDHPSILNAIVDKELANQSNNNKVTGIVDSFFAGCRKYDLYELAQKYYTINPRDIFEIQQKLSTKNVTTEEVRYLTNTIQTGNDATTGGGGNGAGTQINNGDNAQTVNSSVEFTGDIGALYFDNDIPKPNIPVENYLT